MSDNEEGDLVVLLLDLRLFHLEHDAALAAALPPEKALQQVLVFINSYLLLHDHNLLAIFVVHDAGSDLIFQFLGDECGPAGGNGGGGGSSNPAKVVCAETLALLERSATAGASPGGQQLKLSGALSRALCLINRLKTLPSRARSRSKPRIVCLLASPDAPMQYIPVMNAIFSAQRAEVAIDTCSITDSDSTFLQQASHLTGGVYVRPPAARAGALLQHLLLLLTPDTATRSALRLQQEALGVDFRAACFCHKRTIDLGHVCSVCLSIFCEQTRSCSTCGAAFSAKGRRLG